MWPKKFRDVYSTSCDCTMSTGSLAIRGAKFGEGTASIYLDDLLCTGSEDNLVQCPRKDNAVDFQTDCSHSEDAGVICESKQSKHFLPSFTWSIIMVDAEWG